MTCFIVLHYLSLEETRNCVNQIINTVEGNKKIIIIDNGSPNDSGKKLNQLYNNTSKVEVILNPQNIGFAKGNNVGYRLACEKYKPDFIVIMNNDIEISAANFISKIEEIYQKEEFDLLGPDVVSGITGMHQSPKTLSAPTKSDIYKLNKTYEKIKKQTWKMKCKCLLKKIPGLKKFIYLLRKKSININYSKNYYNVVLHGSCLIFSRKFIEKKQNAFCEDTFFYYESEILNYECNKKGLKTMYDPSIQVFHHHSVATDLSFKTEFTKMKFTSQCLYDSTLIFLEIMNGD